MALKEVLSIICILEMRKLSPLIWLVNDGVWSGTPFSLAPKTLSSIPQLLPLPRYPSSQPLSPPLLVILQNPVQLASSKLSLNNQVWIIPKQSFEGMSPLYLVNLSASVPFASYSSYLFSCLHFFFMYLELFIYLAPLDISCGMGDLRCGAQTL